MLVILIAETVLILWLFLVDGSFPVWLSVTCYWKDDKAVF